MSHYFDPTRRSEEINKLDSFLRRRLIGQNHIIDSICPVFQRYFAKLHNPRKPIGNLLFMGPTGVGKSMTIDILADYFFGSPEARLVVDCAEFQHESDIAKLVGSPPGYIGHKTTPGYFKPENLTKWYSDKWKFNIVGFDEIEKANEALFQLMLGITGAGRIMLGDNTPVDFSKSLIILTSNLGAKEMQSLEDRFGFATGTPVEGVHMDAQKAAAAIRAARKRFSPEFMGRLRPGIFYSLRRPQLKEVLELELAAVQDRIMVADGHVFTVEYAPEVKEWLLNSGTDSKSGARNLTDFIDSTVVSDFANLKATDQVTSGDHVKVTLSKDSTLCYEPVLLKKSAA